MLPYATELMLNNANNYGILKTEAVFLSQQNANNFLNASYKEPVEWLITPVKLEKRNFQATPKPRSSRSIKTKDKKKETKQKKKTLEKKLRKKNKRTGKVKKCIVKFMNKGKRGKRRRRKNKFKMGKKMMLPLILGLMAAKSVLIPVVLKALAFISTKGFLMGFFSTILATFVSLKGFFGKSDEKTQVEIIQVPHRRSPAYDEDVFRRGDFGPSLIPVMS